MKPRRRSLSATHLDRRQVGPNHLGGRILLREVAGGQIESCQLISWLVNSPYYASKFSYRAQIPVPVPTSSTRCGFSTGAMKSLLSCKRYIMWWLGR